MLLGAAGMGFAQEYDDIYYQEPKNTVTPRTNKKGTSKPGTHYVPDMSAVDIDAYNRRGEAYYGTPVDTIGAAASAAPDYVYTQQIQQYYNPTIVVNNQAELDEVLNGSKGNVNVIYTGSTPYFLPSYCSTPYLSINISPWGWGLDYDWPWGWGPSWGWGWNTWYRPWAPWNYGWAGPGYWYGWNAGWGWIPSGGWGWGWHGPRYNYAHNWRPNMHGNGYVRPGWASSTRPSRPTASHRPDSRPGAGGGIGGGNYRPGNNGYVTTTRPGVSGTATARPGNTADHEYRPGGNYRPGNGSTVTVRPGASGMGTATARPGSSTTARPEASGSSTVTARPGSSTGNAATTVRPGTGTTGTVTTDRYSRPSTTTRPSSNSYSRPSNSNSNNRYSRPSTPSRSNSSSYSRPSTPSRSGSSSYSRPSSPSRSTGGFSGGSRGGGGGSRGGGGRR